MSLRDDIVAADRRHVWRPYTSRDDHESTDPLVIVRAEGAWLEDADGRRYLDANASWWTNNLGHGHPRLRAALVRQADVLAHCALAGITHEPAAALATELVAVSPSGLTRVFYSDNGSTAVEAATKIAFQYWQQNGRPERTRFVSLAGAYHGDTLGAVSLSDIGAFRSVFGPLLFDVVRPSSAEAASGWERAVESIVQTLRTSGDTIAGVIVEPLVQGAAGMRVWSSDLLARLREATRAADTFLIADEVFTGLGRTGRMWACEHAMVSPDLLCTAKALSGGMLPFAATLATERIFDGFAGGRHRALMHGHTFCGNPLGAALAREVLAIYRETNLLEEVQRKARRIADAFAEMADIDAVRRTRSLGMIGALDLGEGGYHGEMGWKVHAAARARGAYLRPLGDTVYITPCLNIPDDALSTLLAIVRESVMTAAAGSGSAECQC